MGLYLRIKKKIPTKYKNFIKNRIPPRVTFYFQMNKEKLKCLLDKGREKERKEIFNKARSNGIYNIPLFIISYNRLSYIKDMINRLEEIGIKKIIIIDNNSTYKPLLDYYESLNYEVIKLDYNGGYKVFWTDPIFEKYRRDFYMLSDPDLYIIDECPKDIVEVFFNYLEKYPFVNKVGCSLKIDDLPKNSVFGDSVVNWEKKFYKTEIEENVYFAPIDTTLALYLPDNLFEPSRQDRSFRIGYPYQAKHLPWYRLKGDVTDEDIFYSKHKTNGWWDVGKAKMTKDPIN